MQYKGPVYLPIESRNRELDSKLLLAFFLLARGFKVVIGFNNALVSGSAWWPRGVYFLKGMNATQKKMARVFKLQGHAVCAIDEEALGLAQHWSMEKDVDSEIKEFIDIIFCQGKKQYESLTNILDANLSRILVTGNPRVDLLRSDYRAYYDKDASQIRSRHGNFLLVNTNSGSINHAWGDIRRYLGLLIEIGWFNPESESDRRLVDDHLEHDRKNFESLKSLVLRLADQRPDIRVIIRPHPSEKAESWRQIAEPLASVSVVENTDPNPWILASRLVLTTGCTTGLEAALLDRPVVSMIVQREDNLIPPMFLANEINPVVRSISQAIECVGEFWDGSNDIVIRGRELRNQILSEHIEFDSERLASELIANIVEEASANRPRENSKIEISNEHEAHLRKNVKKIHWEKGAFSETDIRMRFDKIFSVLGKHKPIKINSVGWSVFELTPQ